MKELKDYSGQIRPNLKLSDFSPDTLAALANLYSKLYFALDGFWYLAVKERTDNKEALACDLQVWRKMCGYEMKKITEQLNIEGDGISALMKAIQITPWLQQTQYEIEVNGPNRATLTINYCPTLNALEKEGQGREDEICNIVAATIYREYASFFNADADVKCLKSPPRKSKDETCCQWEFSVSNASL